MKSSELLLADAIRQAAENPQKVEAQMEAASACDSCGAEQDAIRYYDAAWKLGVPDDKRKRFMVGYGSTLRNVGRQREAIGLFQAAVQEYPEYVPHSVFLALALHTDGRHDDAMAAAIGAILATGTAELDGYDRALTYYRQVLANSESPDQTS